MKIVYCHNYYRLRGGEDVSFECDLQLLRDHGHTVIPFTRDNSSLSRNPLRLAAQTLWNRETEREMAGLLRAERPDLLHCNNLFPQISPSIYRPARRLRVPIVQALRNYRAFCANSFFYREGAVCTKCLGMSAAWHGLRYGCYRDSRAATGVVVASQLANRLLRTQRRYVDVFVTPTRFARDVYIRGGFDANSIVSRGNFILPEPNFQPQKKDYFVFVGRLSPEKGMASVVRAWVEQRIATPLRIVGDGPELEPLKRLAGPAPHIQFLGHQDQEETLRQIGRAAALLMPSEWYETFGRTIAEAFACGTPVLASRLGAMAELVREGENGLLFEPGSSASVAQSVGRFLELTAAQRQDLQRGARDAYTQLFSAEVSYRELLSVYWKAARQHSSDSPLVAELALLRNSAAVTAPAPVKPAPTN